jgi:hypothetical protein
LKIQITTHQEDLLTKLHDLEKKHKIELELLSSQNEPVPEQKDEGKEEQIRQQVELEFLTKMEELEKKHKIDMETMIAENQIAMDKQITSQKEIDDKIIQQMQADFKLEKESKKLLEERIQVLETEMTKKAGLIKGLEHDNEDLMDIIEKLEEKLQKTNPE